MITEKELLTAIKECEAEPITQSKIAKLADFYIIYDHLFGNHLETNYSFYAPKEIIQTSGENEFLNAINGKPSQKVWDVLSELFEVLQTINPRLYESVIKKFTA